MKPTALGRRRYNDPSEPPSKRELLPRREGFPAPAIPRLYPSPARSHPAKRALKVMEACRRTIDSGYGRGRRYSESAVKEMARVVGAYHCFRHTPRSERGSDWPANFKAFCASIALSEDDVREAIFESRYHRWEEKYVPKVSKVARVSQIKDVLFEAVARQLEAEPGKENANLFRTALQAEGEIHGTQKVTQVNIGSNVLNVPEHLTQQVLSERLSRVQRLAEHLNREVPSVRDAEHSEVVAQGEGRLEVQGPPAEPRRRAEGTGSTGA